MSSPQPNMRIKKKETRQSPFKVPDSKSSFRPSVNEKEDQREVGMTEMRKFLALPIDKKTTHTARMMAKMKKELVGKLGEEEEAVEKEKVKNLKQNKSKTTFPKPTPGRHELKMAMIKRENVTRDSKHDLISMERQKAVLELSILTKRGEILKMDKAIAKEEKQLKNLERIIAIDNLIFEEFLRENEKKSLEARTFFDREAKSKQEKNAEIKKVTAEIGTIKSEIAKFEEILIDYKRYKDLLFKLSPPEWQEAQKAKALKAKVLSNKETQHWQKRKSEESAVRNGKYFNLEIEVSSPCKELPSIRESRLPSAHCDTVITNSNVDEDSSEYEDEPELYFTDPQQLLDLVSELTEQNLSLIQNSTRVEVTVEGLRQTMETTRRKIEKEEEQLMLQINDLTQRINSEKMRGNKLKQKVQLHVSLSTEDQDLMLSALGDKVAEVHSSCVDGRMTNLSTLEKLREEKLREQREKQKERMRRYMERSMADSKKITGRKLMPRCMPVATKVKVSNVDVIPAEDELHAYLFTAEDAE
ncbi:hypothetical protein INR49_028481 [Caranx melampygus]|nr:hypothetical protein INR49_028481 [Caranx melampygus]